MIPTSSHTTVNSHSPALNVQAIVVHFAFSMCQLGHLHSGSPQKSACNFHCYSNRPNFNKVTLFVNFNPLWHSAEALLMSSLGNLCFKSFSTRNSLLSYSFLLDSLTGASHFSCSPSRFVSVFPRNNFYSFTLPTYHSFSLFTSSNSFSRSQILVSCTSGVSTTHSTPPEDRTAVFSANKCNRKRSLLWTIHYTFLRPDPHHTIPTVPLDRHWPYALPRM